MKKAKKKLNKGKFRKGDTVKLISNRMKIEYPFGIGEILTIEYVHKLEDFKNTQVYNVVENTDEYVVLEEDLVGIDTQLTIE